MKLSIPILVLSGGYGKRLKLKNKTQKCLIKVKNQPFISYVIKELANNQFNNFIFLTGYRSNELKNFIRKKFKDNYKIRFSNDGKKNIGVLQAILKALKFVKKDFILVNGDSLIRENFKNILKQYYSTKSKALITISKNKQGTDKNNICLKSGKLISYTKKHTKANLNFIDWGFYIFNKNLIQKNKQKYNNFEEFINFLIKNNLLKYKTTNSKYIQINTQYDLKLAEKEINKIYKDKAIFFDRDGVINKAIIKNKNPYSPKKETQFKIFKSVKKILEIKNDYKIFVISNQPDIKRGLMKKQELKKINYKLKKTKLFNDISYCLHDDNDHCSCRKPKNGLILKLQKKYDLDLKNSFVVGDRWKDIYAGKISGSKTIFIDRKYEENIKKKIPFDIKCNNIKEAIYIIKSFKSSINN